MKDDSGFEPYPGPRVHGTAEACAEAFQSFMATRRSVRDFADDPVSQSVIRSIVRTASEAPSGANKQPWRFVCVQDSEIKRQIRVAAEAEERLFYAERASQRWLDDLKPFDTNPDKPFLETAPWLIAVFKVARGAEGEQHYYVTESVGIATGFLLAAIHHAGLVALTHTPSPMNFLGNILNRPDHERPFLLIPVGHPAQECQVPRLTRKPLDEVLIVDRG